MLLVYKNFRKFLFRSQSIVSIYYNERKDGNYNLTHRRCFQSARPYKRERAVISFGGVNRKIKFSRSLNAASSLSVDYSCRMGVWKQCGEEIENNFRKAMKISNAAEYVLHENENSKGYRMGVWGGANEKSRNNTHFDDKIRLMNFIDRYNKTPCVQNAYSIDEDNMALELSAISVHLVFFKLFSSCFSPEINAESFQYPLVGRTAFEKNGQITRNIILFDETVYVFDIDQRIAHEFTTLLYTV